MPNQASQEANIVDALRLADIAPESVQYVEAHGTGTPVGDPIEAAALGDGLRQVAKDRADRCVIGSIKSNFGHLEAAAGMAGLIKATLCLQHRRIPRQSAFRESEPATSPFDDLRLHVSQQLQPWPETSEQPPRAGVNSFGFGGTNGHVILEAPPEHRTSMQRPCRGLADAVAWMLPLSARSAARAPRSGAVLSERASRRAAAWQTRRSATSVSRRASSDPITTSGWRSSRTTMPSSSEQLEAFLAGEERANSSTGRASSRCRRRPVFVCSGMGQQWWAMGRELLRAGAGLPPSRRRGQRVCLAALAGWSLLEKLTADETRLAVAGDARTGSRRSLRCRSGWRRCGDRGASSPRPSWATAPVKWRRRTFPARCRLRMPFGVTFHRSRLQHRTAGQGSMLAVGMSREEAAELVARHPRAISIAAINGPIRSRFPAMPRSSPRSTRLSTKRVVLQPHAAGGRALSQPEDGAARRGAAGILARYPAAAGVDTVLLHGDRHGADGLRAGCEILVSERPAPRALPRYPVEASSRRDTGCFWSSARIRFCDATSPSA